MGAAETGVRVRVLGGFSVDGKSDRSLSSRKGRTLLMVLVLARGAAVSVDRLADVLWGDAPPARPADQVGVLVSRLRRVVGAERLTRRGGGYALIVDWLDLDELASRVGEAGEALSAGRIAAARAAADAALHLARGVVLPDEHGPWVEPDRSVGVSLTAAARGVAAEAALAAADVRSAMALAEQGLVEDHYDEAMLRVLMRAHLAAGKRASALSVYVEARDRMVEEFGVGPSPETEQLHDEVVLAGANPVRGAPAGTTLPGRYEELAALASALARARTGALPVSLEIVGEAGIGKSALVETWLEQLEQLEQPAGDLLVLVGRCDELGRDLPLQPIVQAITTELAGASEQARRTALGGDASMLAALFGLGAMPEEQPDALFPTSDHARGAFYAALAGVVERLAGGRPIVLVVDDLHLAGSSTVSWLRFIARRPLRLLLVGARRPGPGPLLADAVTVTLGPLELADVVTLVGPSRGAQLHHRSGGHPLLLLALAATDDVLHSPSLHAAVERRLNGLGPAAAPLRIAAVLGHEVDLDLLATVVGSPVAELLEHLENGATAGILVERGAGFAFRHELEREVLEGSVSAARRTLVHGAAARALEERPAVDALAVASHARLGADVERALRWLLRAAAMASARFDLGAAEAYLDDAVALGGGVEVREARSRVRLARSRFDAAAEDAAEAVRLGGTASAFEVSGWVAYYRGRPAEALLFADEGVRRSTDERERVSCMALGGRVRHATGDLVGAIERLAGAAGQHVAPGLADLASAWAAQALVHAGRPVEALARLRPVLVDPGRSTHPFAPLVGRFVRVMALGQLGKVRAALVACDELDEAVLRAGEAGERMAAPSLNCRAWLLRWSGQLTEADELNARAVARASSTAMDEARFVGLLDLAVTPLLARDLPALAASLRAVGPIDMWQGPMAWHQRHRWRLLHAQLALGEDDRDAAAELAASVVVDARERGARRYELLGAAVWALAGGEPAGDLQALDEVVSELDSCAGLDGWPLIGSLGVQLGVRRWQELAQRRAASLLDESPDRRGTEVLVRRLLG